MVKTRENKRLLPGITIPDSIEVTSDISAAVADSDLLVMAVPTAFLRNCLSEISVHLTDDRPVVSVIKGIENETFQRPSEIIGEVLGSRAVVSLSGPSHAEEITRRLPASVVARIWWLACGAHGAKACGARGRFSRRGVGGVGGYGCAVCHCK